MEVLEQTLVVVAGMALGLGLSKLAVIGLFRTMATGRRRTTASHEP